MEPSSLNTAETEIAITSNNAEEHHSEKIDVEEKENKTSLPENARLKFQYEDYDNIDDIHLAEQTKLGESMRFSFL